MQLALGTSLWCGDECSAIPSYPLESDKPLGESMTTVGYSGSLKTFHVNFSFLFMMLALLFVVGAAPTALQSQTYKDLHNFNCATDGCNATYSGIMAQGRDGDLYGTSHQGGGGNLGTVFKLTPSGTISILHNFTGPDGSHPYGGLTLDSTEISTARHTTAAPITWAPFSRSRLPER
jgi:uncharacterized repeat protein (TIGR03803 family)